MLKKFIPTWLSNQPSADENEDDAGGADDPGGEPRRRSNRRSRSRAKSAAAAGGGGANAADTAVSGWKRDHQSDGGSSGYESRISSNMEAAEPELELMEFTAAKKSLLKSSWAVIYAEMGQALSFVGSSGSRDDDMRNSVADTFLRLFEEYPKSQEFFSHFRDTPIQALREDVRLSRELQEHAVRVMQVVEKVIGRLDNVERVSQ